jgi:pimeloyl-ACP methyl ester carboxylesterase
VVERRLDIDGIIAPCLDAGSGDEAAVFVHGNPGSGEDWRALVAGAGRFVRAVAPHMPGFGRASKPADFDYTVDGYARHLGRLLAALGIRRVHLVLHDFGGPWGLAWAAANPSRVASVTLINIGVLRGYRWHLLARLWRTPLLGELGMALTTRAGFRALLRIGNPRGLPRDFVDRMHDDFDAGTRRAILRLYRATGDVDGLSDRLHSALRPLDLPALVVWGERDPYLPARYADAQRETFPRAGVVRLPDSGHFPYADNPAAVADAVLPFLRKQSSS